MFKFLAVAVVCLGMSQGAYAGQGQELDEKPDAAVAANCKHGAAQESRESVKKLLKRYAKMSKRELQDELKRMQEEIIASEAVISNARQAANEASSAYHSAPNDKKSEALLRKIEAQAALSKALTPWSKIERSFKAAQEAYLKLLTEE